MHVTVTSSISGLCRSEIFFPDASSSSLIDPGTNRSPQSHSHTGTGLPQYLLREIFQSGAFSKLLRNLPFLKCLGNQFTFSLVCFIRGFNSCTVTNHASIGA